MRSIVHRCSPRVLAAGAPPRTRMLLRANVVPFIATPLQLLNRSNFCTAAAASRCPWSTLGLKPDSPLPQIKLKFRQLALKLHPDVVGDAEQLDGPTFVDVLAAFEILMHEAETASAAARSSATAPNAAARGGSSGGAASSTRRRGGRMVEREAHRMPPPAFSEWRRQRLSQRRVEPDYFLRGDRIASIQKTVDTAASG